MSTSSAVPADLIRYSDVTAEMDDELARFTVTRLGPALAEFWLSRPDFVTGISEVDAVVNLLELSSSNREIDTWVRQIGEAFARAGGDGSGVTLDVPIVADDGALAAALSSLQAPSTQPPGCDGSGDCEKPDHWEPFPDNPVFAGGGEPDVNDINQLYIGDCYFASSVDAWVRENPDAVKNLITDNGDGTYTVHFHEKLFGFWWHDVDVTVDGYFPVGPDGHPIYEQLPPSGATWYAILEKAYAQWKGGYGNIGNGGHPEDVLSAITGSDTHSINDVASTSSDEVFGSIRSAIDRHEPVTACTYSQGPQYTNSRVVADHCYTVLGYSYSDGKPTIELRNPWGTDSQEGARYHGVFWVTVDDFKKYYQSVQWATT